MRNRLQGIVIFLLIVAPVAIYLLWPTDEARIRKLIKTEIQAAEAEDIIAFMKGISYNYSDDHGLSFLLIKKILEREFEHLTDISVDYSNVLVEVRENKATAVMDLRITAQGSSADSPRYVLGSKDTHAVLNLTLEKGSSGRWIVISSKWPPVF